MAQRFRNLVGPKIKQLRDKLDLTQDQLAAQLQWAGLLDFDRVTVAKVESQIRSIFDYELIVFATVLRVEPGELMEIPQSVIKTSLPKLIRS